MIVVGGVMVAVDGNVSVVVVVVEVAAVVVLYVVVMLWRLWVSISS